MAGTCNVPDPWQVRARPLFSAGPKTGVRHVFWSCPVAAGLIVVLSDHLLSWGLLPSPLAGLLPLHVLLAQPPSSRLHVGLWQVVCLATICALDHVRHACCAHCACWCSLCGYA